MLPAQWFSSRFLRQVFLPVVLFAAVVGVAIAANEIRFSILLRPIQNFVFQMEELFEPWIPQPSAETSFMLLPIAFLGGLIASLSPCILCLLPINLSYIGTRTITSRWDAFFKAALFVLGAVTTLSLIGLFSSFLGAFMVQYRGHINVVVGLLILTMGFSLLGMIHLPMPQMKTKIPAGPYGFGLTFALVVSPCASPVMFGVLAAAAATGSHWMSMLTMVSYGLGYTALLFLASLFTGLMKQAHQMMQYSSRVVRLGGAMMLLMGAYYLINGLKWVVLVWQQS